MYSLNICMRRRFPAAKAWQADSRGSSAHRAAGRLKVSILDGDAHEGCVKTAGTAAQRQLTVLYGPSNPGTAQQGGGTEASGQATIGCSAQGSTDCRLTGC